MRTFSDRSHWMIVALYLLAITACFAQTDYYFKHFGSNDGLPGNDAYSLACDSLGFIWVQYDGELRRFDGYNSKVFKYDPDDSSRSALKFVMGLAQTDHSGNLWIFDKRGDQRLNGPYRLARYERYLDAFMQHEINLPGAKYVASKIFDKNDSALWVGTDYGLFCYNLFNRQVDHYLNVSSKSQPHLQDTIFDIRDRGSCLLLATPSGLWDFNKSSKMFSRPRCEPKDEDLFFNSRIAGFLQCPHDKDPHNWISIGNSLIQITDDLTIIQKCYTPHNLGLWSLISVWRCDTGGMLWFANWGDGLIRYNPKDCSLMKFRHYATDPQSLVTNDPTDIIIDANQNVWTLSNRGLSVLKRQDLHFQNIRLKRGTVWGNAVFTTNRGDHLMMSTHSGTLPDSLWISNISNSELGGLQYVQQIHGIVNNVSKGRRHFWLNYRWEQKLVGYPIDPVTGLIGRGPVIVLKHDPQNINTIHDGPIIDMWEDTNDNLWVSGIPGSVLSRVALQIPYGSKGSVQRFDKGNGNVFFPEDENSIWGADENGVSRYRRLTDRPGGYEMEQIISTDEKGPVSFFKTSDGMLLLGTVRGLHAITASGSGFQISKTPILKGIAIKKIQEDQSGRLWLYDGSKLMCFDRTDSTISTFDESEGLENAHIIDAEQTSKKAFIAISADGISLFDPNAFAKSREKVTPVLTSLQVNNITVKGRTIPGDSRFTIESDVSVLKDLVLDYKHNKFSIEFSAMKLTMPDKIRYRYKLEGYDKVWIEGTSSSRTATYTSLPDGEYLFRVQATNHHGVWSDAERVLHVTMLPPPWRTWWAFSLYALATIATVALWRNYDLNRVRLQHRNEHLAELDQLRSNFIANISHEFRTPLTLILGPLSDLQNQIKDTSHKAMLASVIRNARSLLRLINQLLDVSKIDAGNLALHATDVELVQLLREITSSYESLAKGKNIRYFFHSDIRELEMFSDPANIEKIIHNLLSNAFKFTSSGGEIVLSLRVVGKYAEVVVSDTGIGIAKDDLTKVFDRFYQVDNSQTRGYEGSGLGLTLTKELVDLHRGKISVTSQKGLGTTFTVTLPLLKHRLHRNNSVAPKILDQSATNNQEVDRHVNNHEVDSSLHQHRVLIVEDNPDMAHYIRSILSDNYQVTEARNGKEGMMKAEEGVPDLVVSDIMMPEMDGYKLCQALKMKELTCHIPVVLLTARADRESKLWGLEIGADDYLSKPFDAEELKLIIRNRIEAKQKMHEHFIHETRLWPTRITLPSLDEKFLKKLSTIVEEHIEDENFTIEDFSSEVGYSHTQLYRKIKALTGQTPSVFLRTMRLHRAADMLIQKSDNVTQIAYAVGFSNVSYFNKCFREQFGKTPGQFAADSSRR
ncbi:ATP-binding protein [Chryseolinea sp. T2]|uniref:ATP-binding protein n=1 Tax=Chryseolinea sp. T2 TaxID=3129255 RepID=UPI00307760CE